MLKVTKDIVDKITAHAKKDAPIEACGYLAGKDGLITLHYELNNVDKSPEHYSFDPKEQFAALKDARNKGLQILAAYHSHPETPARMSEEDIRLAYDPEISYIIVSLADGVDIKSFKVKKSVVSNEQLEVVHE